jgi:hypothetical protein
MIPIVTPGMPGACNACSANIPVLVGGGCRCSGHIEKQAKGQKKKKNKKKPAKSETAKGKKKQAPAKSKKNK